jgi:hypothetical protein
MFGERKRLHFGRCRTKEGTRKIREGVCGRVGCRGPVGGAGEGLGNSDGSQVSNSGTESGRSISGVMWEG